jgi:hypothetical protein
MYEYLQRKTSKSRKQGTERYIVERIGPQKLLLGAFPSIAIGTIKPQRFESYRSKDKSIEDAAGELKFDLSVANRRVLLDGLARVSGAMDLVERAPETGDWFTFGVTIYAPSEKRGRLELYELGQLFHDFNFLAAPVSQNQAIALDRSNIYIVLTNEVGKLPVIVHHGGMEERAASLGKKSKGVVVQRVLLRFVRGACEGRYFQESNRDVIDNPNLTQATYQIIKTRIEDFLSGIADRMGIRFGDRQSLHLSAPGWQALGLIFHDLEFRLQDRVTPLQRDEVLDRIAAIDWSRSNPDWIPSLGHPELDDAGQPVTDEEGRPKVSLGRGGRQTVWAIAEYVRGQTGMDAMLAHLPPEEPPAGDLSSEIAAPKEERVPELV